MRRFENEYFVPVMINSDREIRPTKHGPWASNSDSTATPGKISAASLTHEIDSKVRWWRSVENSLPPRSRWNFSLLPLSTRGRTGNGRRKQACLHIHRSTSPRLASNSTTTICVSRAVAVVVVVAAANSTPGRSVRGSLACGRADGSLLVCLPACLPASQPACHRPELLRGLLCYSLEAAEPL